MATKAKTPLAIQIYDYAQMFDSMSLEEASNDLYDVGIKDDNLPLIYEANKNIEMSVKTQDGGLTEAQPLKSVVLQGDTWGPALACQEESKYQFMYKDSVPVGLLGMVDDLVGISEAGYKAQELNAYVNVKTADKKLQFAPDKCKCKCKCLLEIHKKIFTKINYLLIVGTSNMTKMKQSLINLQGKLK